MASVNILSSEAWITSVIPPRQAACIHTHSTNRLRDRPEISTFSTYEITSHKRGEGVAKNVDNLITFEQYILGSDCWEKCPNLCDDEFHPM